MPIFEYKCEICGNDFECLINGNEIAVCDKCGSDRLKKKFSVFGIGSSALGGDFGCNSKTCESGYCPNASNSQCGCPNCH
ncbi:MAG TPA: zinc ribbon domain-containing protein [bacterium]|nr:zinc ribbon domain-containing protein [bacterium]